MVHVMANAPKALVQNAADEQQVARGKLTEKRAKEDQVHNLGVVLSTYEGRQDRWDILATCKVFESIFAQHGSTMSFQAGQQDLGHALMKQIMTHYPDRYLQMQREHMERVGLMTEPSETVDA